MRLKIFTLIAGLILMVTTSAPPSKVEAQGLVEYALILVVVGIGPDERLELYLPSTDPSRLPAPLPPTLDPQLVVSIQAGGGPVCSSQTVQFTVPPTPALINILNVYRGEGFLMINGEKVGDPLSVCNRDAKRVVLTLRAPIKDGQGPVVSPAKPRLGLANHPRMLGYSIVDSNRATVATGGGINVFGGGLALYD